ncbi:MAG: DUF1295 domain-containing protein [Gammaproteobacteria bacterium]|nr:DUF1295 domain-containing protein [Gammaproteobacteria bacterium]
MPEIVQLLLITLGASLAMVVALWLVSIVLHDVSIIDMAFAAMIALLIAVAFVFTQAQGAMALLLLALGTIWAVRLTVYLVWRNWGAGEDPRYTRLRGWVDPGWPFHWLSLRKVFLLQGAVIWVLTLPQQIAMATGDSVSPGLVAGLGSVLWLTGFVFESVGDYQLARFKADAGNRGRILDSGLWRYTRHPNYFGELLQWWGLFLIAVQAPWAWLGVIGPLLYSWLVIRVTGQATLDKKMSREKPDYADYMRRTSGLIPRPPLKH